MRLAHCDINITIVAYREMAGPADTIGDNRHLKTVRNDEAIILRVKLNTRVVRARICGDYQSASDESPTESVRSAFWHLKGSAWSIIQYLKGE